MKSILVNVSSKTRLVNFISAYADGAILADRSRRVYVKSCDRERLLGEDIETLKLIVKMICTDINSTGSFDQIGAISLLLRKKGLCVTEGDFLTNPSDFSRAWDAFLAALHVKADMIQ